MLRARTWASPLTFSPTRSRSQAAPPVLMPSAPVGCLPRPTAANKEQPQNPPQQCRGRRRVGEARRVRFTFLTLRVKGTECSLQDRDSSPFQSQLAYGTHKSGKCLRCLVPALSQPGSLQPDPQQTQAQLSKEVSCCSSRAGAGDSADILILGPPCIPPHCLSGEHTKARPAV